MAYNSETMVLWEKSSLENVTSYFYDANLPLLYNICSCFSMCFVKVCHLIGVILLTFTIMYVLDHSLFAVCFLFLSLSPLLFLISLFHHPLSMQMGTLLFLFQHYFMFKKYLNIILNFLTIFKF